MYHNWRYVHPTRVLFGHSQLDALPEHVGPRGSSTGVVALMTGRTAARANGFTDAILRALGPESDVCIFEEIEAEPSRTTVRRGAEFLRQHGAHCAIALGGGSVIDAAKAMCSIANSDLDIQEIMDRERIVTGRSVRLIAIPTTAGTGSEVTPYSVITNDATGLKQSVASEWYYPDVSILVPEFVQTAPKQLIADVGIDSLAHAFEALWSVHANPYSDALAYEAIRLVAEHLPAYHANPKDLAASAGMLTASSVAGRAFSNTFTAACHALSFPIGAEFSLTHGHACAMTLWLIADLNASSVEPKFAHVARLLDLRSPSDVPRHIRTLTEGVQTTTTFRQLGATQDSLKRVAQGAFAPLLANNPVQLSQQEIVALLARTL